MFWCKYRSSNITLNLCLKILQSVKNMINIHHMLHCLMPRQYVELNFRLDFSLGDAPVAFSDKHTAKTKRFPWHFKQKRHWLFLQSFMSHCASAQQVTSTSLILGNLVVLKISNARALGKQGPTYQAGISIVKCTALRASKETLFIWHPYGNVTLHSCQQFSCL